MSDALKAVLVGCGGMSGAWLSTVKGMEDVATVGLVDVNEQAARKRADEFGLKDALVSTDLKAVLKKTKPDIVYDCTIPEAHCAVTIEALKRGCHVLGEKPLADSMANARKMNAAAQKAGKLFAVIQNRRFDRNIRSLASFLRAGNIATITTLNGDFYIGAHFGGFRDEMEHPLLLDMAIHTFDAARLIIGADPVSVYCKEWNPTGSWYGHDASAVAVFEMTGGVIYTYRGSWCAEGVNTSWNTDWRVIGTGGSVTWDGATKFRCQTVAGTEGFFRPLKDADVPLLDNVPDGGHGAQIKDFIDCVRTGRIPETTGEDNIKSLAMVFGAIESARTGRRVKIVL